MGVLGLSDLLTSHRAWWRAFRNPDEGSVGEIEYKMRYGEDTPIPSFLPPPPKDGTPERLDGNYTPSNPSKPSEAYSRRGGGPEVSGREQGSANFDPDMKRASQAACFDEQQDVLDCVFKSRCIIETKGKIAPCVSSQECNIWLNAFKACQREMANHSKQWVHRRFSEKSPTERRAHDREARMSALSSLTDDSSK